MTKRALGPGATCGCDGIGPCDLCSDTKVTVRKAVKNETPKTEEDDE